MWRVTRVSPWVVIIVVLYKRSIDKVGGTLSSLQTTSREEVTVRVHHGLFET